MKPRVALVRLIAAFVLALTMPGLFAGARAEAPAEDPAAHQILVMLKMAPSHFRPNASYGGEYGDAVALAARRRVAARIARRNGLAIADNWPMPLVGLDCFVMQVPGSMSVEEAVARVSGEKLVAWSQPMNVYRTRDGPARDPLLPVQPAAVAWRLSELHQVATGRGVTVAVIDSKVEIAHPDLAGQFVADRNFVGDPALAAEKHGTGIAGVIAAKAGNGLGIAGIAPEARLMALRACAQKRDAASAGATFCDTLSLAKAIHYAVERNAQVINLSLSGPRDRLLETLITIALARRTSVVAAFDPNLPAGGFPASQPGVIAVADESLPTYPVKVYGAPGRDVPTTQPGGKWHLVSGSSYAAAHVSGLMALVREQQGARPARKSLARGAGGAVDACATLVPTSKACDCPCAVARHAARSTRR